MSRSGYDVLSCQCAARCSPTLRQILGHHHPEIDLIICDAQGLDTLVELIPIGGNGNLSVPIVLLKAETYWHSKGVLRAPRTCLYVGDMESDKEAAEAAEIDFMWASEFFEKVENYV